MPNYKFPCAVCNKPVKCNQKGLQCNTCEIWVHLKCTDLNLEQYEFLEVNVDNPFYCLNCNPRASYADGIFKGELSSAAIIPLSSCALDQKRPSRLDPCEGTANEMNYFYLWKIVAQLILDGFSSNKLHSNR